MTFTEFPKPIRPRLFRLRKNSMWTKTISRRALGVVYALREGDRPTIIRFGAGIYYDAAAFGDVSAGIAKQRQCEIFQFQF